MKAEENYQVEFLPCAIHEMTEIISSFIMLGSKKGALRIKDKFYKAASQIAAFPYSGVQISDEKLAKSGYRMIVVEKYLMFYRVFEEDKKVIFYRVLNGKRNYPSILKNMSDSDEE